MSVPNPVALVTGASSGIGAATARRVAREPGARLVLVARREDRLRELAKTLPAPTTWLATDLTEADAPRRVLLHVREHHDRLTLLVNNAGVGGRGTFAEAGFEGVRKTMSVNFDAVLRLTEALLPLLRASAPSAIVNVSSVAGRVARPGAGAYSASKFALAGWSDSLFAEEREHGVHVALVLPGYIETEGFPAQELTRRRLTRWLVSDEEVAAEAIVDAWLARRPERYVPRPFVLPAVARVLVPRLVRRFVSGGAVTPKAGGES